jgi:hypothetical protein
MCALSCIANAIHFGDLDDPESNISRLIRENVTSRLMEDLGTDPSIYYIVAPAQDAVHGTAHFPSRSLRERVGMRGSGGERVRGARGHRTGHGHGHGRRTRRSLEE